MKRQPIITCIYTRKEYDTVHNFLQQSKNVRRCVNCSKWFHRTSGNSGLYCNKSCATTVNNMKRNSRSIESRTKVSKTLKAKQLKYNRSRKYQYPHTKIYGRQKCNSCTQGFWKLSYKQVTCSPECARKNSTYRKIIHHYHMKNGTVVFLESTWEVKMAQWLDINQIEWIRPNHLKWIDSFGKHRKYFPDFYLPQYDIFLDPKNPYQIQLGQEKLEFFKNRINLLYGSVEEIIKNLDREVGFEPT